MIYYYYQYYYWTPTAGVAVLLDPAATGPRVQDDWTPSVQSS